MTETAVVKPIYKRVIACFFAFLICCFFCSFGFVVPKVYAKSVLDQWEDYTDLA